MVFKIKFNVEVVSEVDTTSEYYQPETVESSTEHMTELIQSGFPENSKVAISDLTIETA